MGPASQLRVFAAPLFVLSATSITLATIMQYSGQKYYMYMMFAGIVCAQVDLGIAWLVFGGGSYWVRLPLIVVLTLSICYVMSYTFPQRSYTWLGIVLVRIPCVGMPLLLMRFRGAHLVHQADRTARKRTSLQFSLTNLLTLFTTTVLFVFAGRFAAFPRSEMLRLVVFSLTSIVSLAAMAAAWSKRHTAYKMVAVMLSIAIFGALPEYSGGFGFVVMGMMLGAMTITVMTSIVVLRILGYRIDFNERLDLGPS